MEKLRSTARAGTIPAPPAPVPAVVSQELRLPPAQSAQGPRRAGYTEFGSDVELSNYSSQLMHEALGFEQTEKVVYYRKSLKP